MSLADSRSPSPRSIIRADSVSPVDKPSPFAVIKIYASSQSVCSPSGKVFNQSSLGSILFTISGLLKDRNIPDLYTFLSQFSIDSSAVVEKIQAQIDQGATVSVQDETPSPGGRRTLVFTAVMPPVHTARSLRKLKLGWLRDHSVTPAADSPPIYTAIHPMPDRITIQRQSSEDATATFDGDRVWLRCYSIEQASAIKEQLRARFAKLSEAELGRFFTHAALAKVKVLWNELKVEGKPLSRDAQKVLQDFIKPQNYNHPDGQQISYLKIKPAFFAMVCPDDYARLKFGGKGVVVHFSHVESPQKKPSPTPVTFMAVPLVLTAAGSGSFVFRSGTRTLQRAAPSPLPVDTAVPSPKRTPSPSPTRSLLGRFSNDLKFRTKSGVFGVTHDPEKDEIVTTVQQTPPVPTRGSRSQTVKERPGVINPLRAVPPQAVTPMHNLSGRKSPITWWSKPSLT